VSLLAIATYQPTNFLQTACNPCGSWLASDGGLTNNTKTSEQLPAFSESTTHRSSMSGKKILPTTQGSTISQCTVRKKDPHSLRL
jgi:hypothetical protein